MNTTDRAVELVKKYTPHQMALRIVELEDIAEIVGQLASERANRIDELQAALELAEEALRAKQNTVADGYVIAGRAELSMVIGALNRDAEQGRPVRKEMADELINSMNRAMISAAQKFDGGAE